MNTDYNYLCATFGTAYLFGALTCLGEGSLKTCAGMALSGAAFGHGLYELVPPAFNELTLKTQSCFAKAQKEVVRRVGEENIPSSTQALEFSGVIVLGFAFSYSVLEAGVFNSSCLAVGSLALWVSGKLFIYGDKEAVAPSVKPPEPKVVSEEAKWVKEHLNELQEKACGIQNATGSDCFLNATSQMILHSPFMGIILDNYSDQIDMTQKKGQFVVHFIHQCYLYGQGKPPQSNWMRSLLNFPWYSQEDASEAFLRIAGLFDTKAIEWTLFTQRQVGGEKAEVKEPTLPIEAHYPTLTNGTFREGNPEQELLIQLPTPTAETQSLTLQKMVDSWTEAKNTSNKISFVENGKVFQGTAVTEEVVIEKTNPHFFCAFNRYGQNRQKLTYDIVATSPEVTIAEKKYEIQSFTCHSGLMTGGHYIAYCNIATGPISQWHRFSDEIVNEASEKEALEALKSATTGYFVQTQ